MVMTKPCWGSINTQGGSEYAILVTAGMYQSNLIRIQSTWVSGASGYLRNTGSQDLCGQHEGSLKIFPWFTQSAWIWPRNVKNHNVECDNFSFHNCQVWAHNFRSWVHRRSHLEKSRFPTDDLTLLLVALICVPRCPQKQLQDSCSVAPFPRNHLSPQMENYSSLENECLCFAIETSGAD